MFNRSFHILTTFLFSSFLLAWSPIEVDIWNPPFNKNQSHSKDKYIALEKAKKKWRICVSIPHLKDAYWLAVNYGLVEHAKSLGVSLNIYSAGGYDKLDQQRKQLQNCLTEKYDAVIIGAIQSDGLDDLIQSFHEKKIPVIDLINGISSPLISARTAADFFEMGKEAGKYTVKNFSQKKTLKIAWFPGPKGAGWAEAGDKGFRSAFKGKNFKILESAYGDTGLGVQTKMIHKAFQDHPDIDIIAGTAVSAEAGIQELRRRKLTSKVKIISYYFSPAVHRGIQKKAITVSPSDVPGHQARLSVDIAVKALEKLPFPKHLSASIQMIDFSNINKIDLSGSLAPEGFRGIFSVNN